MTIITGDVIKLSLTTPNGFWSLVVPMVTIVEDFLNLAIQYERLDQTKTWGAFDTLNGDIQITKTNSLYAHIMSLENGIPPHIEIEIKEVI